MTKDDARKILGIPRSAGLKPAERAYHQKKGDLQLRMLPGNPLSDRQQAQAKLVKLTDAWNTMQTKQSIKKKHPRPKRSASKRYPKPKWAATKPRPARQTTALDPRLDMADYWDIIIEMVPLPKPVVLAILIIEFALVITILFLRTMKGA